MITEPELTGGSGEEPGSQGAAARPAVDAAADAPADPVTGPVTDPVTDPVAGPARELTPEQGREGEPEEAGADVQESGQHTWLAAVRRERRPWVLVLAGAVGASVLWAGGLAGWHATHPGTPDMHGYSLGSHDPCSAADLEPIYHAVHPQPYGAPADTLRTPALDRTLCGVNGTDSTPSGRSLSVFVSVALHKRTDPGPEFRSDRTADARGGEGENGTPKVVNIPGLGDEAYFLSSELDQVSLHVRHGGLVCTLNLLLEPPGTGSSLVLSTASDAALLTTNADANENANASAHARAKVAWAAATTKTPAADDYRPQLIAAARRIMASLKDH